MSETDDANLGEMKTLEELQSLCPYMPVDDRMVVVPIDAPVTNSGSIIIPEAARDKKTFCLVVHVGQGFRDNAGNIRVMQYAPGDRVLMNNTNPDGLWRVEGIKFSIVREHNVIAVMKAVE